MKKITSILFVLALMISSHTALAQDSVPKELLLSTLNGVAHLKLEDDQINQIIEYNKGFVDEIYEVLHSDSEEKYKKKSMKILGEKRENDFKAFLGNHKTNKYLKLMEDEMKPLGRREHLFRQLY